MRRFSGFFDAFLDGFTMAGFLGGLRRPSAPDRLFALPPTELGPDEADLTGAIKAYLVRRGRVVAEPEIERALRPILARLAGEANIGPQEAGHASSQ